MKTDVLARIKGLAEYEWLTYTGPKKSLLGKQGSKLDLEKGDTYGVRHSSSGKEIRLVSPKTGLTRVFTLDVSTAEKLAKNSKPLPPREARLLISQEASFKLTSSSYDDLLRDLSNDRTLQCLGWGAASVTPLHQNDGLTLTIGNHASEHGTLLGDDIREATSDALRDLGWVKNPSGERAHWSFTHSEHPVTLRLQWKLGKALDTGHALGQRRFPLKYVELYAQPPVSL